MILRDVLARYAPPEKLDAADWLDAHDVGKNLTTGRTYRTKWRPSIFMPRWASRITLRVESVRVERLNDISEADAVAEGVFSVKPDSHHSAHWLFAELWDGINGKRAPAASDPWVWVVTFSRVTP